MHSKIGPIVPFGEDTATDAEQDCWLVLGDLTKTIADRCSPQHRAAAGQVIYTAFPGRRSEPQKSRKRFT